MQLPDIYKLKPFRLSLGQSELDALFSIIIFEHAELRKIKKSSFSFN